MASSPSKGPDFGHYPYKLDDAHRVLEHPEDFGYLQHDNDPHPREFTSHDIVEATNDYVRAQRTYYADTDNAEKRIAFTEAEARLVRARADHRRGRVGVAAVTGDRS